ncbi:hypothetical protein J2Z49_001582 [Desulfofundulus luciae]|uniref:Uncharacterized protein n=1 Tax=Desulfofundulus luciae TaxID=74702 RepID=A0ABU0B165_9FIRM|nr:hypothetical protein [Desulfofundulus luciae]
MSRVSAGNLVFVSSLFPPEGILPKAELGALKNQDCECNII